MFVRGAVSRAHMAQFFSPQFLNALLSKKNYQTIQQEQRLQGQYIEECAEKLQKLYSTDKALEAYTEKLDSHGKDK